MDNRFRVQGYVVRPLVTMYGGNHQPAVMLKTESNNMLFAHLTVNLEDPDCDWHPIEMFKEHDENGKAYFNQYVDTNNLPGIEDILKNADWCEATGKTRQSGFCTYPMYRFYSNRLECCSDFKNWREYMSEVSDM